MAKSIEDRFIDQLNNYLGQHLLNVNIVAPKVLLLNHYIQKRLMLLIINIMFLWAVSYENDQDTLVPREVGEFASFINSTREQWSKYAIADDLPFDN